MIRLLTRCHSFLVVLLHVHCLNSFLLCCWYLFAHVDRRTLTTSGVGQRPILAPIALTTTARSQLLELLRALLTKVLKVNLHDLLDQIVHLGLVLDHLCYVHNLFPF